MLDDYNSNRVLNSATGCFTIELEEKSCSPVIKKYPLLFWGNVGSYLYIG